MFPSRSVTFFTITAAIAATLSGCAATEDIGLPRAPWQAKAEPPRPQLSEPQIRVRLRAGAESLRVESASGGNKIAIRAVPTGPGAPVTFATLVVNGPLKVHAGASGIAVVDGSQKSHLLPAGSDVELAALDPSGTRPAEPGSLRLDKTTYPGSIVIHSTTPRDHVGAGRFDIIAHMPLENYLPGVIAKETYTSWPQASFEAQAVASRSYAMFEQRRAQTSRQLFDVEASTNDQMFAPGAVSPQIQNAVTATRGQVLYDEKGEVLRAVFSSCCGGRPASAMDVWPSGPGFEYNKSGPLQAAVRVHDCTTAPKYRWQVTRSTDETGKRLIAWAQSAGNPIKLMAPLRSIEVAKRSDTQRPRLYKITDERSRTYEIGAEQLRAALNFPIQGQALAEAQKVWSSDMEIDSGVTDVRFLGRGFGHGVGLCQFCAKGMAQRGVSWREMVATFYPDSQVARAY